MFLMQLGLSQQVAIALLVGENALEALIEPILGRLSDRQQRSFGSRIPIINIGVILASALFLVFPCLIIFDIDISISRWLFPLLAVAWACAMAIFRSPAMSILGRCANPNRLPQAASVLTLVGSVVGAFRFDAYGLILQLGAGFAFALGSFSLLVTGGVLRWLNPPEVSREEVDNSQQLPKSRFVLIFITGMLVGWGMRFLIPTVRQTFALGLSEESTKVAMTIFFMVLGISAIPAGKVGTKLGNHLGMIWGCLIVIISVICLLFLPSSVSEYVAIAFLLFGLSLVLNGAVPYALALASDANSGFGVGLYFGGGSIGASLFPLFLEKLLEVNIVSGTISVVLSFVLVLGCLFISNHFLRSDRATVIG